MPMRMVLAAMMRRIACGIWSRRSRGWWRSASCAGCEGALHASDPEATPPNQTQKKRSEGVAWRMQDRRDRGLPFGAQSRRKSSDEVTKRSGRNCGIAEEPYLLGGPGD